jgi:NADH-quinone oxidoreductase subunit M
MLTVLLILFPIVAVLLFFVIPTSSARTVALGASIVEFALAIFAYTTRVSDPQSALLSAKAPWIETAGIWFNVQMDGISTLMVLLTTVLVPLIIWSSFGNTIKNSKAFYSLILLMEAALVGVFVAKDGFLFYVFWELALIPIYFICLLWGGEGRARITFKFFLYTLFGSLFMLAALIYIYLQTPTHSFAIEDLYQAGRAMDCTKQCIVFWALFLAFAIKMPVFPFHTWQPDTYTNSPTQGTMLLSGIMLKMGTYGLLRWLLPLVPMGWSCQGKTAVILSVISIVYASCIAIVQKDFKRMIAYSSIAHVGLIAAGLLAFNVQGVQGALIQMVSHGINVVGLFYICDIIMTRTQTGTMANMGGIRSVAPQFALLFLIIMLGSVALPLTNGFVGEFLLITGVYQYNFWLAVFAGLTIILGAVYMLRGYQTMMLGETSERTSAFTDVSGREKWILIVIAALVIIFGVFPKPILDLTAQDVQNLVEGVKSVQF